MTTPRVVVADHRRLHRDSMAEALRREYGLLVLATAEDPATACLQARRVEADVVVVSARLLDALPEICESLHEWDPRPRVLVIDAEPDADVLVRAIEAGADGFLTGEGGLADVAAAADALVRGEAVVPPVMLGPLLRNLIRRQREASQAAERLERLTRREREVLSLLTEGLDDPAIASELVISPETVRTHVQRILRKLEVHSRVDAIGLVGRTGLTDQLARLVGGGVT